jgi:hypothetical protein
MYLQGAQMTEEKGVYSFWGVTVRKAFKGDDHWPES